MTTNQIRMRRAVISEQGALEELQRRASLNNPGDRDALLAHHDAIQVPAQQIRRVTYSSPNGMARSPD